MRRVDISALWAGIAILAFGVLLYVQENGNVDIPGRWLLAWLGACLFIALLSPSLGRSRRRADPAEAAAFDSEVRALVEPYSQDTVELRLVAEIVWGKPLAESFVTALQEH